MTMQMNRCIVWVVDLLFLAGKRLQTGELVAIRDKIDKF